MTSHKSTRYFLYWLAWAGLIVYGSLMPFEVRPYSMAAAIEKFRHISYLNLGVVSRADWIANILIYMPLAYLCMTWLSQSRGLPRVLMVLIAAVLGLALAVGVEFTQIFFAPRTVSLNDLIAESIGTVLGLAVWLAAHARLAKLAAALVRPGPAALTAGLIFYALVYLGMALFPYDFVLSLSELQWKLLIGHYGWGLKGCGSMLLCGSHWLAVVVAALPLGMLLTRLLDLKRINRASVFLIAAGVGVSIEAAQFLIASGVSTFSAGLAIVFGISLGVWLRDPPSPALAQYHARWLRPALLLALIPYLGLVALLNGWANADWSDVEGMRSNLAAQRYLPFYYHYFTTETHAVASLLGQFAVYLPMGAGFWLWHASGASPLLRPPLISLLPVTAVSALIIETGKLFIKDAHPDPTNILIALGAAWLGQRLFHWLAECAAETRPDTAPVPVTAHLSRKVLLGIGVAILVFGAIGLALIQQSVDSEAMVMAQVERKIPTPDSLPPASLPYFRLQHPRLPVPSAVDIIRLELENRSFLDAHRNRANKGHGSLDAAILMAYVEPGSQDLDAVFKRLMDMKFSWRGYQQGKILAQAYDWLYGYWDGSQRRQFVDKLVEGCNYLINVIRRDRFSPYNEKLYSGPMQALMACSIALYRDDPRGDPVMAFTTELWKNRILPVWQQVMGNNGGWHEGADITSAGIGQAIYKLPNMWRSATGEDQLRTMPGIRGFLDFLVYRTRPDGNLLRLGDSRSLRSDAPDRRALALEFGHAAAYSLYPPPEKPVPTSWPWGPLSNNSLYDPAATATLPLSKHFDGIGLVVMRDGWGPDATYITFKAGDNYSSYTHLDQGSFTIFKGAALALDSGLYYHYGSDHHLNYAYQTIAHNVATVTDPGETDAIANSEFNRAPRPITNDGGQRRIGGDIEIYPHPLNIDEWNAKRDVYHTGKILKLKDRNDVVSIMADITAAYTNRFSGEGTISSRSLRVKRYLRSLVYDRTSNLLLVYDSILKTDPTFTSRWLIHFPVRPVQVASGQYLVSRMPDSQSGQAAGLLETRVLLPQRALITAIGGPGKEFWIDGRNYDDDGRIYKVLLEGSLQKAEAGSWRLEITPADAEAQTDQFLVALITGRGGSEGPPSIKCTLPDGVTSCTIRGKRTLVVKFSAEGRIAVYVEG